MLALEPMVPGPGGTGTLIVRELDEERNLREPFFSSFFFWGCAGGAQGSVGGGGAAAARGVCQARPRAYPSGMQAACCLPGRRGAGRDSGSLGGLSGGGFVEPAFLLGLSRGLGLLVGLSLLQRLKFFLKLRALRPFLLDLPA